MLKFKSENWIKNFFDQLGRPYRKDRKSEQKRWTEKYVEFHRMKICG